MIHYFRRIRQKLLTENRFTRYLIYAIGEIALVMIGILLALQVNNWNEQRKSHVLEKKLLREYRSELRYNMEAAKIFNKKVTDRAACCQLLLSTIEHNMPYTDSLSTCYHVLTRGLESYFSHEAYNTLTTQAFDLIRSDSLKKSIMNLQTFQYGRIENRIENQVSNVREYGRPILRHRLKALGNLTFIPVDYEDLMQDVSLWNILMTLNGNYKGLSDFTIEAQNEIKELDLFLTEYLKS